jgi:hypothetical protein
MVMANIRPLPSDPPPLFKRELDAPAGNLFTRFIAAHAVATVRKATPQTVASVLWPSDRNVAELIERAASAPAMTTVSGWAAELAHKVVVDALATLGPASAAIKIIQRGLVLSWDGAGQIAAPGFVAGAGNASFVVEGNPIPVRQLAATAALLNPHKLAAIAVLTREMIESSNAEAAISDALVTAAGAAMDAAFFDANPEDASRSAGMKYGIAATTPSAATDLWQAAFEDVAALINAISPVGGAGPYILVGSPGRVVAMQLRFNIDPDDTTLPIFYASNAIGADLAAIAPAALVAAASPTPDVETANAGTLVMDTAPGPAGTMGTEKSLFQTNSMAIKIRWPVSWVLRDARGFAWLTPNWKPG